jgi:energy-coupling factor transporter ATP-binding protein EcfA2
MPAQATNLANLSRESPTITLGAPGFLQWLSVFALATDPDLDVMLLDEPDAHLHSSLQEQLLDSLRELATVTGKQILIATHSAEILRNAEASDILHIRSGKGGRYLVEESQKVGLLAGLGTEYAPRIDRAKRTKRVLFVEGRADLEILKTFAECLGIAWPDSWVVWTSARGHKERKQIYAALKEEIPTLVVMSLRDRDDEPAETVGADLVDGSAGDADFHPRRWRRRYIESYLILPPAIAAAAGIAEDDVRQQLTDRHAIAVGATFTDSDAPPALLDVRAKQILRPGDGAAVLGQFDVSPVRVAKAMVREAVPDDIKTFLSELAVRG